MLTTYKQTDTNNVARVSLLRSGFWASGELACTITQSEVPLF